jgi:transposase
MPASGMARPKLPLVLTDPQKSELLRRTKTPSSTIQAALRARIVLLASDSLDNAAIATQLGTSRVTVGLWRSRFLDLGLPGLEDFVRSGRPSSLPDQKIHKVITEVVRPPAGRKRWSCRSMAKSAGVSVGSVHRLWRENDLKPHLTRTFKLSNDPEFERKFWDIIGLYLRPPTQAVILCCDEKSQCQALERSQPALPLGQGHIRTQTHDYYRHGTITLFAAMNYLSGKVLQMQKSRHRHQEWLKFLESIDLEYPGEVTIHLIIDNYATHKHAKVKRWLERHPRFQVHFTPTSASWMNLVERFFRDLSQDCILPGSFGSVEELAQEITKYMEHWNLNPTRYEWKADGKAILERISRARAALAREEAVSKPT